MPLWQAKPVDVRSPEEGRHAVRLELWRSETLVMAATGLVGALACMGGEKGGVPPERLRVAAAVVTAVVTRMGWPVAGPAWPALEPV